MNKTCLLSQICNEKRKKIIVHQYKITGSNVMPIVSIDENALFPFKVFILQEATNYVDLAIKHLGKDGYLIISSDILPGLNLKTA